MFIQNSLLIKIREDIIQGIVKDEDLKNQVNNTRICNAGTMRLAVTMTVLHILMEKIDVWSKDVIAKNLQLENQKNKKNLKG